MSYAVGQDIKEDEYNIFVTGGADGTPDHDTANVNTVWGVGTGDKGYGQAGALSSVSTGGNVTATQWATLLDRMDTLEAHQGSAITNPTNPTGGDDIDIFTNLSADITTLFDSRLDNDANAGDASNTIAASGTWTDNTTQTARFTWSSANHARYYFNAGGEIRISFARTGGTSNAKNDEWTQLASDCGTLVFGARTMAKVGGAGIPTTEIDDGWYDISTSFVIKFKQIEGTNPYELNFITVEFRTADVLQQLEIRVIYKDDATDDNPADDVDGTFTTTFIERPPSTAELVDTWGNPSFTTVTNTQDGS